MTDQPAPITWEDVMAMYQRMMTAPPPTRVWIIGTAAWGRMLDACIYNSERRALNEMKERGQVVISEFLPDDNQIYEWNPS